MVLVYIVWLARVRNSNLDRVLSWISISVSKLFLFLVLWSGTLRLSLIRARDVKLEFF